MNYTVKKGIRSGFVKIPSSKSYAHRALICAALSNTNTTLLVDGFSKDILATAKCLAALGTSIEILENAVKVGPMKMPSGKVTLPCNESGSTLRFLLPVAAALGVTATFEMADGLAARPVDDLLNVMKSHKVDIRKEKNTIMVEGKMTPGEFSIPGNVSSQYISGLLMALPLLDADSKLTITGKPESMDYVKITEDSLRKSGIHIKKEGNVYTVYGKQTYVSKKVEKVEEDWSNAAFFFCMGALSKEGVTIQEMQLNSTQGDREILNILREIGADVIIDGNKILVRKNRLKAVTVDASAIPDLVPVLATIASLSDGTSVIKNAGRLRIKESDRLKTTHDMLKALGADIEETADGLIIKGQKSLKGGTIDACNDHRIAMSAAVAACGCEEDVVVEGAQCVEKSYPKFWEHLEGLERINE